MDLNQLRAQIDETDKQIVELFSKRMDICKHIAMYKHSTGKKVFDPERERKKLAQIAELAE